MTTSRLAYSAAILAGFRYLLSNYSEVFIIGQGLWSPWYVGTSMTDLDKEFGPERVIDSPVSELAVTGAAIGASMCGYRPVVVHPRMDFMILAMDQIVNQAAKWSHMFGGNARAAVTIRSIINRGGEQGAQHSQALHAWFAHVPGLRVVTPATPADARDLLIASVLSDDPVLYIDDRWLYEVEQDAPPITEKNLRSIRPQILRPGSDFTLVGNSYSTQLCLNAAHALAQQGISCEVIDLRVINPLIFDEVVTSVNKTGHLAVIDGGWRACGLAGEVIAGLAERISPNTLKAAPVRITLPDAPAPTSKTLEEIYYPQTENIIDAVVQVVKK
ncbi:MAG: alpha-ketoacid dehydrogenase subunit beta [Anaerolineae bacterium]|nr:alpha-ketoacid dehydrogenase subunit beta [Anaerolineae bacterium]